MTNLGSVRLVVVPRYDELTDTWSVNAANAYTYTPFGGFYEGQCVENIDNPFKFTGQWHDAEIDQYYLRARMYDPAMMRFTGRDLVRGRFVDPMSLHKYLYCANEPINRIDWNGKEWTLPELVVDMGAYAIYGGIAGFVGGCTEVLTAAAMGVDMSSEDIMKTMSKYVAGGVITGAAAPLIAVGGTGALIPSFSAAEYWTLNGMLGVSIGAGVGGGLMEGFWDSIDVSSPLKTNMKSDYRQMGILLLIKELGL